MSNDRAKEILDLLRARNANTEVAAAAKRSESLARLAAAFETDGKKSDAETIAQLTDTIANLHKHIHWLEDNLHTYQITSELGRRSTIALLRNLPEPSVIVDTDDLDVDPPTPKMKVTAVFDDPEGWLQLEGVDE